EGHVTPVPDATVDSQGSGTDPFGHTSRAIRGSTVDGPGQAVRRVVGDTDGIIVAVVCDDDEHRTENLLASCSRRVVQSGDHGRLDPEAGIGVRRHGATGGEPTALLARDVQIVLDPITLY